jgi:hypothetical protein
MSTTERILRMPISGSDSTDANAAGWPYPERGVLKRAYIDNVTAVSAHDTNYITVTVTQNSTTLFARATTVAGGALAANTLAQQSLGASMVGDKLELEQGESVTVAVTKAGTGPAYKGSVVLVYEMTPG